MLAQIVGQQAMLKPVDGGLGVSRNLVEAHPYQDCTPDMVADNSCFTALTTLDTCNLLDFAVKLLDLPAPAAYVLDG